MYKKRIIDDVIDIETPPKHEEKTGSWIYDRPGHWKCSKCGYMEGRISQTEFRTFCPVCGTKLR